MTNFFDALYRIACDACDHYDIDLACVPAWYLLIDNRGYWIEVPHANSNDYAELKITRRIRIKNWMYRRRLRITNFIAEHSFGIIKHYWFY